MRPTPIALPPIVGTYHDGKPMRLGQAIHVANPGDKRYTHNRYLFDFGSGFCSIFVLAYGSLDDALEEAAGFCAEQGWTGIVEPEPDCGCDDPFECGCHTYTEAGWIVSHEWGVSEPTNKELQELHWGGHTRA